MKPVDLEIYSELHPSFNRSLWSQERVSSINMTIGDAEDMQLQFLKDQPFVNELFFYVFWGNWQ